MQTLITLLLLSIAAVYLLLKWMPASAKQKLVLWIFQYSPSLAKYLGAPASGCGSGCSSCGTCSTSSASDKNTVNEKPVKFIRQL